MNRRKRTAVLRLGAGVLAGALVAALVHAPPAAADVPGPYFATQGRGSDPHIIKCTDPSTNTAGFCLYTSYDMGAQYRYPGNYYPMKDTYAYFSPNGYSNWVSKGVVAQESWLYQSNWGWIPDNAYHQWAPAAAKNGSYYYLYVPNVSDKSNDAPPNVSTSSRIQVLRSTSPFGPFSYQGYVTLSGYMSDPEVFVEGSNRYVIWADGDATNCGGFKSAKLNSDMKTITSNTVQTLTINGIGFLGNCGGKGRPYLEGASLFKFDDNRMPGPYTLVFAVKPIGVPNDCKPQWNGNDANGDNTANTDNEAIAYATASTPQGPYTYRGIIMCGSTTEWTNQATIAQVTIPNGEKRWMIVYHDAPANIKERKLHAECLFAGHGKIGGVFRQPLNASNGFNDCMTDVNGDYIGYQVKGQDPALKPTVLTAPRAGADPLLVDRFAVGPWERFREVYLGNNLYAYQSLANGKYVCASVPIEVMSAKCTSTSSTTAQFYKNYVNEGFRLQWRHFPTWVRVSYNGTLDAGQLFANEADVNKAAVFTPLSLG